MFNLVRAFFKEKKRFWMSKILRIFLRGQPNVPSQKNMWLHSVWRRDFLQEGKNEKKENESDAEILSRKTYFEIVFRIFRPFYSRLLSTLECTGGKSTSLKKLTEILIKRTSQLRLILPEQNTVKKIMGNSLIKQMESLTNGFLIYD